MEEDAALADVGLQALDAQLLVRMVLQRQDRQGQALPRGLAHQHLGKELLELHRLHGPERAAPLPLQGDHVLYDAVGMALADVGHQHMEPHILPVQPADEQGRRIAPGPGLAQRGIAGPEMQQAGRQLRPEAQRAREGRGIPGKRIVLLFGVKGGAVFRALAHERIQGPEIRPARHGPGVHRLPPGLVEGARPLRPVRRRGVEGFPCVPQVEPVRHARKRPEGAAAPLRFFEGAGQHAVVMQDGAYVDHVHAVVRRAQGKHGAHEPAFQLVPLFRAAHVLVVLQIVQQGQVGPVRPMPQAAHALARAEGLYLHVAGRADGAHVPDAALPAVAGKVRRKAGVALQFGLDRLQEAGRLLEGVGHQQDIPLALRHHAPEQEKHVHKGGLGFAARGRAGQTDALRRVHGRGQRAVQPEMQGAVPGGRAVLAARVVREVRPPEKGEVLPRPRYTGGGRRAVHGEGGAGGLYAPAQGTGQRGKLRPEIRRRKTFRHAAPPVFPSLPRQRAPALPAGPPRAGGTPAARIRSAAG